MLHVARGPAPTGGSRRPHCILLTTHYLLLTTDYLLLTTHCSLPTTRYSLLTTYYLLLTTAYLLLTDCLLLTLHCSLLTTHYSSLTTHYSPLTTHYSPLTIHYPLHVLGGSAPSGGGRRPHRRLLGGLRGARGGCAGRRSHVQHPSATLEEGRCVTACGYYSVPIRRHAM